MTLTTLIGSILLALLVGLVTGGVGMHKYEAGKAAIALQKAQVKADEIEANWRANTDALTEVKDEELRRISHERDRYLAGMRRASQRLSQTPTSCSGASPAALSAPDATVALGFGSEADQLRANYAQCKAFADEMRK